MFRELSAVPCLKSPSDDVDCLPDSSILYLFLLLFSLPQLFCIFPSPLSPSSLLCFLFTSTLPFSPSFSFHPFVSRTLSPSRPLSTQASAPTPTLASLATKALKFKKLGEPAAWAAPFPVREVLAAGYEN